MGALRVADRLRRELGAERLFVERYASLFEELSEADRQEIPGSLLIELAKESCESGFPEGSVSPVEILESPSFRECLGHLIAQRRSGNSSVGDWPERIAGALFGKRGRGHAPVYAEAVAARRESALLGALHDAIVRSDKEVPPDFAEPKEIEAALRRRGFKLKPPQPALPVPEGWAERYAESFTAHRLPELARKLAEYRKDGRGVSTWDLAARWVSPGSDAAATLDRLRKRKTRRKRQERRT